MEREEKKVVSSGTSPEEVGSSSSSGSRPVESEETKRLREELRSAREENAKLKRELAAWKSKSEAQMKEATEVMEELQRSVDTAREEQNQLKILLQREMTRRIERFKQVNQGNSVEGGDDDKTNLTDMDIKLEMKTETKSTQDDSEEEKPKPTPVDNAPEPAQKVPSVSAVEMMEPDSNSEQVSGGSTTEEDQEMTEMDSEARILEHAEDDSKSESGFFCICGRGYESRQKLQSHIRYYTDRNFLCDICEKQNVTKRFSQLVYLKRHKLKKHNISCDDEQTVGCSTCGNVFPTMADLWKHKTSEHSATKTTEVHAPPPAEDEDSTDDGLQLNVESEQVDTSNVHHLPTFHVPDVKMSRDSMPFASTPVSTSMPNQSNSPMETTDNEMDTTEVTHALDIGKLDQGHFCRCGVQFITRQRLDSHLRIYSLNLRSPKRSSLKGTGKGTKLDTQEMHAVDKSRDGLGGFHCTCGSELATKTLLDCHVKYYNMKKIFPCSRCSSKFRTIGILNVHMMVAHQVAVVSYKIGCTTCGIGFRSRKEYDDHHMMAHGTGVGARRKAKQRTDVSKEDLLNKKEAVSMETDVLIKSEPIIVSLDRDEPEPVSLPQPPPVPVYDNAEIVEDVNGPIQRTVVPPENVASSSNVQHQIDESADGTEYLCICGKEFSSLEYLKDHICYYMKNWKHRCNICNKCFLFRNGLKSHMMGRHQSKVQAAQSND